MKIKKISPHLDFGLLTIVFFLVAFGVLMVYDASSVTATTEFNNRFYYAKEQMTGFIIGSVGMLFAVFFNYRHYYKLSLPFLLGALFMLLLVFVPGFGVSALGAHRWINLKFINLQPSEITKLVLVIYLSAWLSAKEKGRLLAFLLLMGLVVGLIILEPDMGTAVIIIATSIIMYFISGAPVRHFFALIPVFVTGLIGLAVAAPYRLKRILTFFDSNSDPLGSSYHVRQALIALGSGGLFGLGLGKSRQKFSYLPEASTDSIFAIIAEELGFIGSILLIMVFVVLIYKGYKIAQNAPDPFGRLLAFGITSWFALQIIINLSSMVALTPLTGIPLPFISYGSSAMVVELYAVGILINISSKS